MNDLPTQCQQLADNFGKNYERAIENPRLTPKDKSQLQDYTPWP